MKYFTLYFLIMSPCSASDLHSIVHPWRERLGEPCQHDRLLALEIRQLVGLAVTRLEAEIGSRVADLQLGCRGLCPAGRRHHQHRCHHHCTAHSIPPCPGMISRDACWTRYRRAGIPRGWLSRGIGRPAARPLCPLRSGCVFQHLVDWNRRIGSGTGAPAGPVARQSEVPDARPVRVGVESTGPSARRAPPASPLALPIQRLQSTTARRRARRRRRSARSRRAGAARPSAVESAPARSSPRPRRPEPRPARWGGW